MAEHTPGPWEVDRDFYEIQANLGMISICDVLSADVADWEANARLIAASPELLTELEKAAPVICSKLCASVWSAWEGRPHCSQCRSIRAAIAKARGTS